MTGRLHSRVLGPVEDDTPAVPVFRPIGEEEWLSFSEASSPQVRKISLRDLGLPN